MPQLKLTSPFQQYFVCERVQICSQWWFREAGTCTCWTNSIQSCAVNEWEQNMNEYPNMHCLLPQLVIHNYAQLEVEIQTVLAGNEATCAAQQDREQWPGCLGSEDAFSSLSKDNERVLFFLSDLIIPPDLHGATVSLCLPSDHMVKKPFKIVFKA